MYGKRRLLMSTALSRLLLAFAALPFAFSAMAEIYKWVDESGRVNYGDKPGGESSSLQIDADRLASENDSAAREEKRRRLLESMQEDRLEKEQLRARKKAEREREHRMCIQYKDRMRQFERASTLYSLDTDGNRIYMSNEERDRTTRDLQSKINKHCH
jgi:hypothetical protein